MDEKATSDDPGKDIAGKKIMWVEDDSALNDILKRWLERYKAELVHAENGTDALEVLRKEKPDILLLDVILPDINGFEVLEQMKSDSDLNDIPVIIFSNLSHQEDIDRGYQLGAARFMVKSTVFLENLATEIRNVLRENGKL